MAYECRIVADSVTVHKDSISRRKSKKKNVKPWYRKVVCRVTTFVIVLPRNMLAEFNTHRDLSRNSASSRAIPTKTFLRKILSDTFVPEEFGTAIPRMNAGPPLEGEKLEKAMEVWGDAAVSQIWFALSLTTTPEYVIREWDKWVEEKNDDFAEFVLDIIDRIEDKENPIHNEPLLNVTKGLTNRLLEPFVWHEIIVTATEWENFFALRTDNNAQREIRVIAQMMKEVYDASEPELLKEGEWHLPFIQPEEKQWAKRNPLSAAKAVTARCARVSYLTHDKKVIDLEADYALADSLAKNGHMSPFEHALYPIPAAEWKVRMKMARVALRGKHVEKHVRELMADRQEFSGNVRGFAQARRDQLNQQVFVPQVELEAA